MNEILELKLNIKITHTHQDIAINRLNRPSDRLKENLPKLSSNSDTKET